MLVTSILCFSRNVFKRRLSQGCLKMGLCDKECDKECLLCDKECLFDFNPLSNDKIVDWFKLKAFADDMISVNEKLKPLNHNKIINIC